MELFLIYIWLKLDAVIGMLYIVGGIGLLLCGFALIPRLVDRWDTEPTSGDLRVIKLHNRSILISSALIFFGMLLPTAQDTAVLVGSSIAIDVAKSPEGTKIATLLRGKANEILDEQLKQLKGTK